eukprot:ANDGO_05024.mRNA.1 Monothiol glutaredoxin-4
MEPPFIRTQEYTGKCATKNIGSTEKTRRGKMESGCDLDWMVRMHKVVCFIKGTPAEPKCGFTARFLNLLHSRQVSFAYVDVIENEWVRTHLPAYSNWPTFPQLFVDGQLVGGVDVLRETIDDVFPLPSPNARYCRHHEGSSDGYPVGIRLLHEATEEHVDLPQSVIEKVHSTDSLQPVYAFVANDPRFKGYGPFVLKQVVPHEDSDHRILLEPFQPFHEPILFAKVCFKDSVVEAPSPWTWNRVAVLAVFAIGLWWS